jgi:hypothetical protein
MTDHQRADFRGERLDALAQRVTLIGQADVGALSAACPGDTPAKRAVVGDAEHETALATHQTRSFRHGAPDSANRRPEAPYDIGISELQGSHTDSTQREKTLDLHGETHVAACTTHMEYAANPGVSGAEALAIEVYVVTPIGIGTIGGAA